MDPNEALAELRRLALEDDSEWADIFTGLDNWISRGGHLPQDWKP